MLRDGLGTMVLCGIDHFAEAIFRLLKLPGRRMARGHVLNLTELAGLQASPGR